MFQSEPTAIDLRWKVFVFFLLPLPSFSPLVLSVDPASAHNHPQTLGSKHKLKYKIKWIMICRNHQWLNYQRPQSPDRIKNYSTKYEHIVRAGRIAFRYICHILSTFIFLSIEHTYTYWQCLPLNIKGSYLCIHESTTPTLTPPTTTTNNHFHSALSTFAVMLFMRVRFLNNFR